MVTLDDADLVGSICKAAVTVTVAGLGTISGAVNRPESLIVPTVEFPPCIEFTCQVTAELPAFCTFAVNGTVVPAKGCAEAGDTVTTIAGGGGVEETKPPQELKNIATNTAGTTRNDEPQRKGGRSMASRSLCLDRTLPRKRPT
jgi:hypothetical protein